MIVLTRLNGQPVMLNGDLIESAERDDEATIVTLTTGNTVLVRDGLDEICDKTVAFKRRIHGPGVPGG